MTDQRPPTYTGEPTNQTPPDFNLGGYIDPIKPRLGAYRATFEVTGQRGREMTAEVERLTKDLVEMTSLRDNALRAAEHADQSIDVDLEGVIGDGLASLGVEWEGSPDDSAPPWLLNAVVDLVRPVVAHAVKRAESAEAKRDALKAELAEQTERTLNAAADMLYALPATDGAALKGPYWYRQGFTQAADLLRDWADYPAALDHPTEERPMSELGLDAIKARADAATPGPWTPHNRYPHIATQNDNGYDVISAILSERPAEDIRFVAHAREDVPALVTEVKRLRAELASAKLDHIADHDDAAGELAKVDVEVERLRSVLDRAIQGREMARIERNALKAAIERIRALHTQGVMPDMCKECNHVPAADCPTLRALDTPVSPKGAPDAG